MEKMYPDNWAWPGVTALMYNVDIAKYFQFVDHTQGTKIKPQYQNALEDVGMQWKKASASSWTTVSLKNDNQTYINYHDQLKDAEDSFGGRYACVSGCLSPLVTPWTVLIKGLDPSTSYNLRMYGVVDGTYEYYNAQTISTMSRGNNVAFFHEIEYDDDAPQENIDKMREVLPPAIEEAIEIFNMFHNYDGEEKEFYPKTVYDTVNNWTAESSMTYNSAHAFDGDNYRSVTVHEVGHNWLFRDSNNPEPGYKNYIIKFMEFATGCPMAMWRWMGNTHNYPIISSERYTFVEDCKVVAAFQLWHTYQDEQ